MILAIDIGNTHMVLGCLNEQNEVITQFQLRTDTKKTVHEYAVSISQSLFLEKIPADAFNGAIISSVVPDVKKKIAEVVRILLNTEPLLLGEGVPVDMGIDMNGLTVDDIAGDLIASSVAAKEYYPLPVIIADVGTATTVVVVDQNGNYIGGCILPGPATALSGLVENTALLPAIDFSAPDRVIAKDTINSMRSGIIFGSAGALDGILERFEEEIGKSTILMTGGLGEVIAKYCRHEIIVDRELLLKGLGLIWKYNN